MVESFYNAFTLETFIDRLAKAGSGDPVELRLELFSQNPRAWLFDTYPLLTMEKTSGIEVHIVKGQGPMASVGEPGLPPPIALAVANALLWRYCSSQTT